MFKRSNYDLITIVPSTGGMNQNISPEILPSDFSYHCENIFPNRLGEFQVRYGTEDIFTSPASFIESFSFQLADGGKQDVLYLNDYQVFSPVSNLRIISSNHIRLTSANYSKFQKDTYFSLIYKSSNGISPVSYYLINKVTDLGQNTIDIEVELNTFPTTLEDFFITFQDTTITRESNSSIKITVPNDFNDQLYFNIGQKIKLTVNGNTTDLTVSFVDDGTQGFITFTFNETTVPNFTGGDTVSLAYESKTPEITSIANSVGIIKVRNALTNQILTGPNQTITNLSVACVPRSEFFDEKLWIYNGVDPVMTWDGTDLKVYEEYVKESAQAFNRVDDTHFTFTANAAFDITKYQNNNKIQLKVGGVPFETTVSNVTNVTNTVTLTVADTLPAFTAQSRVELSYSDKPPHFSYMKSAHGRLWALGPGAVGLEYRDPDQSLRIYYSYLTNNTETSFRFFNETTKAVPSDDISSKHGCADNLEAIMVLSGYLVFLGRQATQVWSGTDPININSPNAFTWSSTLPVGIYHGNLIVELANDFWFLTQGGFLSFSTLNIAKQFAASSTQNMNRLAKSYIDSINSNFSYRACRSFKYKMGSFCGFKIGLNNVIMSMYSTSLYWWGIFSGDFANATSFSSTLDECLYIYIDDKIYRYADGVVGKHLYADQNGEAFIAFSDTRPINPSRTFANKFYEIDADYSSSVVLNPENHFYVYVKGNLRKSFITNSLSELPYRGDLLGTIPLVHQESDQLNKPTNKELGFRLDSAFRPKIKRLKFVSSEFWVSFIGKTKNGPINFKKLTLYGVLERTGRKR